MRLPTLALAGLAALPSAFAAPDVKIHERVVLLDGSAPLPAESSDRSVILAFPGIGGAPERSLFFRCEWKDGKLLGEPAVRVWQQQANLQPSQIAKQTREVEAREFRRTKAGGWAGRLALVVATPEQVGHEDVVERFELSFEVAPAPGEPLPVLRSDYSTPPWRRLDWPLAGTLLRGTARGSWEKRVAGGAETREIEQSCVGSEQPLSQPGGPWSGVGDMSVTVADGGLRLVAKLSTRKTDAGEGVSRALLWPERRDLSRMNALLVTYRSERRPGAAFGVSLQESPGLWYAAPKGLPLAGGERQALIPFSGLSQEGFDMDHWLTPASVGGIRFSAASGDGIGEIAATIVRVEAVRAEGAGLANRGWGEPPTEPARVELRVDTLWSVNGEGAVPDGLFGVHGVGLPGDKDLRDSGVRSVRTITDTGDFKPSKKPLDRTEATAIAAACGPPAPSLLVECWSHGLLSPPPWFNGIEPAAARFREFGASIAGQAWSPEHPERTLRRMELLNEPFMWARHINLPDGRLVDPTQHGHLPAELSVRAYVALFCAASAGRKETNPHLEMGGPSSASFSSDDWRHLTEFVLPVIAGCGADLDFATEHHYQGRGPQFAAEYEVFQAAVLAQEGRRIPLWNTECNDLADTPGAADAPIDYSPAGTSRRRAAYHLGEILAHLRFGPDHTRGRAVHALWSGAFRKKGETLAFQLMSGLRGDLLFARSDDPAIMVAATRAGDDGFVLIYNDGPFPREVVLAGGAPFATGARKLGFDPAADVTFAPVALGEDGSITVPPLGAVGVTLRGLPPVREDINEIVRYAREGKKGALWEIAPGGRLTLDVPGARPSAYGLRIVAEGLDAGEATILLGDVEIPLPPSNLGPPGILTVSVPFGADPSRLEIRVSEDADGFRLCSLSVVWRLLSER